MTYTESLSELCANIVTFSHFFTILMCNSTVLFCSIFGISFIITKTRPCNIQRFFSFVKIENFLGKKLILFLIFAQNICCGYTLEPPRPPSMFKAKIRKIGIPLHTPVFLYKVGLRGYILHGHVFLMLSLFPLANSSREIAATPCFKLKSLKSDFDAQLFKLVVRLSRMRKTIIIS